MAAVAFAALLALSLVLLATRLNALRALQATGPNWSFPSRVYSAAVPLVVGRRLPDAYLIAELEARGYRSTQSPKEAVMPGVYRAVPGELEIGLRGFPDQPGPMRGGGPERVRVRIDAGHLTSIERLGAFEGAQAPDPSQPPALEPVIVSMLFDPDRVWRTWVSLERIPEAVRDAVVAAEDRRFYTHLGVDLRGTLRALRANMQSGEIREGGSTITQQLARNLFVGRERTLARKLAEVPVALGLELLLSKQEILEMYLNSVYLGQAQGFGVGGITEAARWYFDAPVESLGTLEGATLAAIIPAPNVINPFQDPQLALERRNDVLADLVETGRLDARSAAALRRLPLGVRRGPTPVERFPSFASYVQQALEDRLPRHAVTRLGLSIHTALDVAWQERAEAALAAGLYQLDGGGRRRRLEGAFVALEPSTAAVVAMVGGRSPKAGEFNRAYQAQRQSGSAIKPIVYAAAFASPQGFTPATTVPDTTRVFGKGRWAWKPRNYDGSTHPEVTLAKALEKSLNIATANLVDLIGPSYVARSAENFGLGRLKPVASIGLGTNEVSLLQLTGAYAVFNNRGMRRTPSPVRAVVDRTGRVLLAQQESSEQAISEGVAALMTGLLENVVRYGVAYPLRGAYGLDRPVAGKTGTTDDYKDAWFVGFTPDVVAGVWLGYDRPRSIGRQAAHTALPVWARIVGEMLAGFPPTPFAIDSQLQWLDIDPWTGFLADSLCPAENVPFIPGTGPVAFCHHGWLYDEWGYAYESPDSLYLGDTTWFEPAPEQVQTADTLRWKGGERWPKPDTTPLPDVRPEPDSARPEPDDNPPPQGDRPGSGVRTSGASQLFSVKRERPRAEEPRGADMAGLRLVLPLLGLRFASAARRSAQERVSSRVGKPPDLGGALRPTFPWSRCARRPAQRASPPRRPASRASSSLHSCPRPDRCDACPPLRLISRCCAGSIAAKPRRLLRGFCSMSAELPSARSSQRVSPTPPAMMAPSSGFLTARSWRPRPSSSSLFAMFDLVPF